MSFWSWLFRGSFGGVKYVRKYTAQKMGPSGPFTCTYEMYRAKTAQEAREFLETKSVAKKQ